jgi:hypothetical protein
MRTPSILLALALSAAGAAQSLVKEEGPLVVTASFDADRTCGRVSVGRAAMASSNAEDGSPERATQLCLDIESAKRLVEERRLHLLPVTRWISRTADRLAAKIEDL